VGQLPLSWLKIILGKILLRLPCSNDSFLGVVGNAYCQGGRLGVRDDYFGAIMEMLLEA
jgi:hypothetical protein